MSDKTSIHREDLLKIASLIRPALATQTFIPAYNHIAFDGEYALTHNDIAALQVRCRDFPVPCCVPGELFIKALGSFTAENVMLQKGDADGTLLVVSGRSRLKVPTMALKSFPFAMPKDPGPEVKLSAEIIDAIDQCLLSAGTNPNHPSTMGVTLDVTDDGDAVLFATDNYTISRRSTKKKISLPGDSPVILPTFFCNQLIALTRAFPKIDPILYILPGALVVEFGEEAALFSKTISDIEPLDFQKMIKKHVRIDNLELETIPDAFDAAFGRQMLVLGAELDKMTKVVYDDGIMKLKSTSQVGDSDESFSFKGPKEATTFHVDPSFVIRASKLCDQMAIGERVFVMAGDKGAFLHLIAHVAPAKKGD